MQPSFSWKEHRLERKKLEGLWEWQNSEKEPRYLPTRATPIWECCGRDGFLLQHPLRNWLR
jgi:hypothetical protein